MWKYLSMRGLFFGNLIHSSLIYGKIHLFCTLTSCWMHIFFYYLIKMDRKLITKGHIILLFFFHKMGLRERCNGRFFHFLFFSLFFPTFAYLNHYNILSLNMILYDGDYPLNFLHSKNKYINLRVNSMKYYNLLYFNSSSLHTLSTSNSR